MSNSNFYKRTNLESFYLRNDNLLKAHPLYASGNFTDDSWVFNRGNDSYAVDFTICQQKYMQLPATVIMYIDGYKLELATEWMYRFLWLTLAKVTQYIPQFYYISTALNTLLTKKSNTRRSILN